MRWDAPRYFACQMGGAGLQVYWPAVACTGLLKSAQGLPSFRPPSTSRIPQSYLLDPLHLLSSCFSSPLPMISAHLGAGTTDFRRFSEGVSTTVILNIIQPQDNSSSATWDGAGGVGREGTPNATARTILPRATLLYCFQRQLVLAQHRRRARHDSQ